MISRKIIFLATALILACGAAFSQERPAITFGAWGRAVVTPAAWTSYQHVNMDGETVTDYYSAVSAATFTSGDVPNMGFTVRGNAPNADIGFVADLNFGGARLGFGDNAKIWAGFFNMAKLTAGWFKEDELRGKVGTSEFANWVLRDGSIGEDNIFHRFDATAGLYLKITPLDWLDSKWNGLSLHGAIGSSPGALRAIKNLIGVNHEDPDRRSMADVYQSGQFAIGYQLPGIGLVRGQLIGNNRKQNRLNKYGQNNDTDTSFVRLMEGLNTPGKGDLNGEADIWELAFQYNGLSGLNVDAGIQLPAAYEASWGFTIYNTLYGKYEGSYELKEPATNPQGSAALVQQPYIVAVGMVYEPEFLSGLRLLARGDLEFKKRITTKDGTVWDFGNIFALYVQPSYQINKLFRAGADFGMEIHSGDVEKTYDGNETARSYLVSNLSKYNDMGFGLWAELRLSGGTVRAGFMSMFPGTMRYEYISRTGIERMNMTYTGKPIFSVPIMITYSL
jgi:hypothetical protein